MLADVAQLENRHSGQLPPFTRSCRSLTGCPISQPF
jgi:hypothetical protein